jgi:hypothetical protein
MIRKSRPSDARNASRSARKRRTATTTVDPESARRLKARLATPEGQALLEEIAKCYARAALNRMIETATATDSSTPPSATVSNSPLE